MAQYLMQVRVARNSLNGLAAESGQQRVGYRRDDGVDARADIAEAPLRMRIERLKPRAGQEDWRAGADREKSDQTHPGRGMPCSVNARCCAAHGKIGTRLKTSAAQQCCLVTVLLTPSQPARWHACS